MLGLNSFLNSSGMRGGGGEPLEAPVNPVQTNYVSWLKYGTDITSALGAVSQWGDASGSGHPALQANGAKQPLLQANGAVRFDGVTQNLQSGVFTLIQPVTIYLLWKRLTTLSGLRIFDGRTLNGGAFFQQGPSAVALYAGTTLDGPVLTNNTYVVSCLVFNGASSILQMDNGTPETGPVGAGTMGGFSLADDANGDAPSNIEVAEMSIYSAAHDATTRGLENNYLLALKTFYGLV